ncbi:antitoxin ParD1/3/4 [Devosia enhydra]|uniref:Antitoxin ParD1/3/4 n=1 Tax=Devosia enhydra TaxID=665118 RepID=A0A1K2HWW3_9HYPH|nr:type II toxin-antitoxin system ParD family antitoxin [Devosia enhydra]SFZ83612.1 antitoxin ParD1/3/4 [Devosia enhydra]
MATMNISLPDAMKAWVEAQVATGRYANASDLMRDLIRKEQGRADAIARMQALIDEGLASPVVDLDMDTLRAEVRAELGIADADAA